MRPKNRKKRSRPPRWTDFIPPAVAAALIAAAYLPALRNGFVWLDHAEIEQKVFVVESWGELARHFVSDPQPDGYFRPWYTVAHSLDYALWGLQPFGFHLSSIAVHVANALLMLLAARWLGGSPALSLLVALTWGLHPRLTASVGLIHARSDPWSLCWMLVTLCVLIAPGRASPWRLAVASLTLAAAALAKEVAYLFPAGLFLWMWLDGRLRATAPFRRRDVTTLLAMTGTVIVMIVWRQLVSPDRGTGTVAFVDRVSTFGAVYLDNLLRLLTPIDLSIRDTTTRFFARAAWEQAAVIAGLIACAVAWTFAWRRLPHTRVWIALFHLSLLPVAQLVPLLHVRADRFFYLPSVFFVAGVVVTANHALARRPELWPARQRWVTGASCALLATWFAATYTRLPVFLNDQTLFAAEIAREPQYREGLASLAVWHDQHKALPEAEALYRRSLEVDPRQISYVARPIVALNLSRNLLMQNKPAFVAALATEFPELAASRDPMGVRFRYNLARAAYRLSRFDEALPGLSEYVSQVPVDADAHYMLGRSALATGDRDRGRAALARYLALRPNAADRAEVQRLIDGR